MNLYYAYTAGHVPEYTEYAAADVAGVNGLLMGYQVPYVVVLVSVLVVRRATRAKSANWISTSATGWRSAS